MFEYKLFYPNIYEELKVINACIAVFPYEMGIKKENQFLINWFSNCCPTRIRT